MSGTREEQKGMGEDLEDGRSRQEWERVERGETKRVNEQGEGWRGEVNRARTETGEEQRWERNRQKKKARRKYGGGETRGAQRERGGSKEDGAATRDKNKKKGPGEDGVGKREEPHDEGRERERGQRMRYGRWEQAGELE